MASTLAQESFIYLLPKTSEERRAVLASIGPVWDGNEVWLIASGGTLYSAFPALYAASFSGFYLALMNCVVAIDFARHRRPSFEITSTMRCGFAGASALLVLFFGAALGNVVRGVPLDADGYFFLPLWTNLQPGSDAGIIDWYTLLAGFAAVVALTMHGALWVALKTTDDVSWRSRMIARHAWTLMLPVVVVLSVVSFYVQPHLAESFRERPWGVVFPSISMAGLLLARRGSDLTAFLGSGTFLFGLLASAAFGLYPYVLPSNVDPTHSLTVANAAAPSYGLSVGFYWFIPAILLALGYTVFVYLQFKGKVDLNTESALD